jgi:tetratricopeptide (TPR) repeat protein
MRRIALAVALFFAGRALPEAHPSAAQVIETGKILPEVRCLAHPEGSYALYLPSGYSPQRRWPLIVSSDPGAHGTIPLELQKDAAERYGYVLAASNDSRNGPWKPRLEDTETMLRDVQARFAIDPRRVYFAGFSGGARFSSELALLCKCSAGVLLSGAGFTPGLPPAADNTFPVFSTAGALDFNYKEVIPLQDTLAKEGYPHWLRAFEGPHEWPPSDIMEEALAWFRIQEMKSGLEARDQSFIEAQFAKDRARAESLEQSGDLLDAWREYRQVTESFDSLADVTAVRAKAEALGREKAVRQAAKRERSDFGEERRISSGIMASLRTAPGSAEGGSQSDQDLRFQIGDLRRNAAKEKRPEKDRVYKRALGDAIRDYEFATKAKPDSAWAWERLAVAYSSAGNKKEALSALRKAYGLENDKPSFRKWLETEVGLARLRSMTEFREFQK